MFMTRTADLPVNDTPEAQVVELEYATEGFVFDTNRPQGRQQVRSRLRREEARPAARRPDAQRDDADPAPLHRGRAPRAGGAAAEDRHSRGLCPGQRRLLGDDRHAAAAPLERAAPGAPGGGRGRHRRHGQSGKPPAPQGVVVKADKPFLFVVRDRKRNLILALGRIGEPGSRSFSGSARVDVSSASTMTGMRSGVAALLVVGSCCLAGVQRGRLRAAGRRREARAL